MQLFLFEASPNSYVDTLFSSGRDYLAKPCGISSSSISEANINVFLNSWKQRFFLKCFRDLFTQDVKETSSRKVELNAPRMESRNAGKENTGKTPENTENTGRVDISSAFD